MSIVVSSIVGVSMNKIVLRIRVRVDDWTAERAIIASNVFKLNDDTQKVSYVHYRSFLKMFH